MKGASLRETGMALRWNWFSQETCLLGRGAWHLHVKM